MPCFNFGSGPIPDLDGGLAIYWLNGAKAADDYADFYDGNWDSNVLREPARIRPERPLPIKQYVDRVQQ